ncbi:hypothetical protein A3737_25630, partial [Oleiphilus sp. HI0065]
MTDVNNQTQTQPLSEDAVVSFLRDNPDFFVTHEYLLDELRLPHKSGSAISLGERQVQVFREHRDELRTQLHELVEAAQQNDKHFEKSKRLLLDMMDVKSLDEIEYVIQAAFKDDEKIDFARVVVFGDPDDYPAANLHIVSEQTARDELGTVVDSQGAICGRFTDKQLDFLFQQQAKEVGSAALIPLRNDTLYGVFSIASKDPAHFDSSMGSLFLSYISDFITRLLPA